MKKNREFSLSGTIVKLGVRFDNATTRAHSLFQAKRNVRLRLEEKHGYSEGKLYITWGDCYEVERQRSSRERGRQLEPPYPCADMIGTKTH